MKYSVERGSGTKIYILSFMKIGSDIHKSMREGFTDSLEIA
jgi:hypothetical protein